MGAQERVLKSMIVAALLYGAIAGFLCLNVFFSDEPLLPRVLIFLAAWTWPISLPIIFMHDFVVAWMERRRILKSVRERLH